MGGLLAFGAGDDRHRGPSGASIASAVGEAVVLSPHGPGAAGLSGSAAVGAGCEGDGLGVVSRTEALAGAGSVGAAVAVVDGGTVTGHEGLLRTAGQIACSR